MPTVAPAISSVSVAVTEIAPSKLIVEVSRYASVTAEISLTPIPIPTPPEPPIPNEPPMATIHAFSVALTVRLPSTGSPSGASIVEP